MKKIFVLFLAIFIMALFSTADFAAATCTDDQTETIALASGNKADVGLSANVVASYCSSDGTNYAAATYNPKGVGKAYGTASDTTYVYYKDCATGLSETPDMSNGDSRAVSGTGWNKVGE